MEKLALESLLYHLRMATQLIVAELELEPGDQLEIGVGSDEVKRSLEVLESTVNAGEPNEAAISFSPDNSTPSVTKVEAEDVTETLTEPPPVLDGHTRVEFDSILNTTEKSWQIDFGDVELWIPISKATLYNNYTKPDGKFIIDIDDWLYDIKFPNG